MTTPEPPLTSPNSSMKAAIFDAFRDYNPNPASSGLEVVGVGAASTTSSAPSSANVSTATIPLADKTSLTAVCSPSVAKNPALDSSVGSTTTSVNESMATVGRRHPPAAALNMNTLDNSREEDAIALAAADHKEGHWVVVSRLDTQTSTKMLHDLFFPYGASEAFLLSGSAPGQGGRRTGYVVFPSRDMAALAAQKMHAFIPCRQSTALSVELTSSAVAHAARARDAALLLELDATEKKISDAASNASKHHIAQLALLVEMAATTPKHVAHYIQQQANAEATATEVIEEMDTANATKVRKFADSLAAVMDNWPQRKALQTAVVRLLLAAIIDTSGSVGTSPNSSQATIVDGDNEQLPPLREVNVSQRRQNSGTLLGLLFLNGFLHGDPFEVASRLLKSDIAEVSQLLGICNITSHCTSQDFPRTSAAFWAQMAEVTGAHPNPEVRVACSQKLASRFVPPRKDLSPDAKPFDPPARTGTSPTLTPLDARPGSNMTAAASIATTPYAPQRAMNLANTPPSGIRLGGSPLQMSLSGSGSRNPSPLQPRGTSPISVQVGPTDLFSGQAPTATMSRRKIEEIRSRTVYMSRLSPHVPCTKLRELVDACGTVLKMRVCVEPGYSTLFGFIEMNSVAAAKNLLRRDKMDFYQSQIRFQPAKMPVQDADPDDALEGANGALLRLCQYALYEMPSVLVCERASAKRK